MNELVPYDISEEAAMRVAEDPVIQHLMKNVDRAAIRENLKLTPEQRVAKLQAQMNEVAKVPDDAWELKETVVPPPKSEPPLESEDSIDDPVLCAQRDPVIQSFMDGVDRTLIRENLKLTHEQRLMKMQRFCEFLEGVRRAGERHRALSKP